MWWWICVLWVRLDWANVTWCGEINIRTTDWEDRDGTETADGQRKEPRVFALDHKNLSMSRSQWSCTFESTSALRVKREQGKRHKHPEHETISMPCFSGSEEPSSSPTRTDFRCQRRGETRGSETVTFKLWESDSCRTDLI